MAEPDVPRLVLRGGDDRPDWQVRRCSVPLDGWISPTFLLLLKLSGRIGLRSGSHMSHGIDREARVFAQCFFFHAEEDRQRRLVGTI